MKTAFKTAIFTGVMLTMTTVGVVLGESAKKDASKYDCRVFAGYKLVSRGGKIPDKVPIFVCPHADKMAAGKCEMSALWGMRCKE